MQDALAVQMGAVAYSACCCFVLKLQTLRAPSDREQLAAPDDQASMALRLPGAQPGIFREPGMGRGAPWGRLSWAGSWAPSAWELPL